MRMHAQFQPLVSSRNGRRKARLPMRLEVLGLEVGNQLHNAIVHDLSADGMLIETTAKLEPNTTFQISLPNEQQFEGTIVWTSGHFFGCEFLTSVGKAGMSAARLKSAHKIPTPTVPRRAQRNRAVTATNSRSRPADQLSLQARIFAIGGLGFLSWLPFIALGRLAVG